MFKHLVNKPSKETVTMIIKNAVAIEQVGAAAGTDATNPNVSARFIVQGPGRLNPVC